MKLCISVGHLIKNPCSPLMHNAGYKQLGIDNKFSFLHMEVKPSNLKKVIEGIKALDIKGASITMPHKEEVIKYLDVIDKDAKKIGAVNTIVNNNGKLFGYNTDWIGAITALENHIKLKRKNVALIGAGGAARAIAFGLKKSGAKVKIFNRTLESAKKLSQLFDCEYGSLGSLKKETGLDVIINTTPVGMGKDNSLVDKKILNKRQVVFDIIYFPKETKLIKDAKEMGAKVIYGYEMLLYQGTVQFKLYTGKKAPTQVMREALEESL